MWRSTVARSGGEMLGLLGLKVGHLLVLKKQSYRKKTFSIFVFCHS